VKIAATYSHLNGEEYLIARCPKLYKEIKSAVAAVDASKCVTKSSKEKTMLGKKLFSPPALNQAFKKEFRKHGWNEKRYSYCITLDRRQMEAIVRLPLAEQKKWLIQSGSNAGMVSFKQTDFVKGKVAVEVQFGKYAFVAFDLFVKHLLFYSGEVIDVGVEILPMKALAKDAAKGGRRLSTGIAYYEGEVYNVMRHGRTSPPVPLLIIGICD
jgi:Restriction endonuclease BglII